MKNKYFTLVCFFFSFHSMFAQKQIGVYYSNWFDYPTNWTNTGGCVWGEPALGWYKSADPAVIDQHTEWLVNNGADFVMFDWSNNCDNSGSNIQLIETNSIAFAERQVWRKQNGLSTIKFCVFIGTCGNCDNATNGNSYGMAERVKKGFLDDPNKASLYWNFKGKPFLGSFVLVCESKGIQFSHPSFTYRPITVGNGSTDRGIFWSWEENAPNSAGYSTNNGEKEAITIQAAYRGTGCAPGVVPQYPNGLPGWLNDGTVFGNKTYPRNNGQTFRDAFDFAISQNTQVIMIQSFNEWTGCLANPGEEMDQQRSNDLEPMKGGHGDLYLQILKEKAAKYKGNIISSNNKNYWNFDIGIEGWSGLHNMTTSVTNGNARMTVTGVDPYIYSPDNLNINASDYKYILVAMRNESSDNQAQIYFSTNSSPNIEEAKSIKSTIMPNDAGQRYYLFDMSSNALWNGTIKQLRFDPVASATAGSVTVDFIKFVGTKPSSISAIPGTIEAEDFDLGGQGNAYFDTDATNNGGQYRTTEAVDIEICADGGYNIGWTAAGEWMEYLVNVTKTDNYKVQLKTSSPITGNRLSILVDGIKANTVTASNTGGWQVYSLTEFTISSLTKGNHIIRILAENGGVNIDKVVFSPIVVNPQTITPYININNSGWVVSSSVNICIGSSVWFGPHPNVETGWTWKGPNGFTSSSRSVSLSAITIAQAGNYTATYTDANGVSNSVVYLVNVNSLPVATITPARNIAINAGASTLLTASLGSSYQWYKDNIATAVNASSFTVNNAGSYTVAITNAAGCTATSLPTVVTINPISNSLPTVNITTPLNNASYTAPANITIAANASDVDGTISKVEFYSGTNLLGTDVTSPYSYIWSNVTAGSYTLTAKAYDNLNSVKTSAGVLISVNSVTSTKGINGPACVLANNPTKFTIVTEAIGTGQIQWWTNSGTPIQQNPLNPKEITIAFPSNLSGSTIGLFSGVNYTASPWYKEYSMNVKVGGCPASSSNNLRAFSAEATETGLENSETNNLISVYPNPANNILNVQLKNITDVKTVYLLNVTGEVVLSQKIESTNTVIDIQNLSSGMYMLKVGNTIHKVTVSK